MYHLLTTYADLITTYAQYAAFELGTISVYLSASLVGGIGNFRARDLCFHSPISD